MRTAHYARVSTHGQQTLVLQVEAVSTCIKVRRWNLVSQVKEVGSDARQRTAREGRLRTARRREVDVAVIWRLDRGAVRCPTRC
jgi:DNA invertase Pin-like site-specific DNA recombinase